MKAWTRSCSIGIPGLVLLLAGCAIDGADEARIDDVLSEPAAEAWPAPTLDYPDPDRWYSLVSWVEARADSVDTALRRVSNLSSGEQRSLRIDVNAVQTARARQMGVPRTADPEQLLESGRLVALEDSSIYWVVRRLDYSSPYVTPDAYEMLREIGVRFHAALDSVGLPPFRFEITSVMRTAAHQAALQRSNANAARGVSAHEFGTTVDVAYRRFTPPLDWPPAPDEPLSEPASERLRQMHDHILTERARQRGAELQAILGRAILSLRNEGKLLVMMERNQTVYHMTVARSFPPPASPAD